MKKILAENKKQFLNEGIDIQALIADDTFNQLKLLKDVVRLINAGVFKSIEIIEKYLNCPAKATYDMCRYNISNSNAATNISYEVLVKIDFDFCKNDKLNKINKYLKLIFSKVSEKLPGIKFTIHESKNDCVCFWVSFKS